VKPFQTTMLCKPIGIHPFWYSVEEVAFKREVPTLKGISIGPRIEDWKSQQGMPAPTNSGEMAKRVRRIQSIWRYEKGADYNSVLGWTMGLKIWECSSSILLCVRSVIHKAISCLLMI
jgi:hypothetical protein